MRVGLHINFLHSTCDEWWFVVIHRMFSELK